MNVHFGFMVTEYQSAWLTGSRLPEQSWLDPSSYGRGGGVGRGLGVSAGLGVGEGLGVEARRRRWGSGRCRRGCCSRSCSWSRVVLALDRFARSISRQCSDARAEVSAPDDHFTAGPDCRVISLGQRAR